MQHKTFSVELKLSTIQRQDSTELDEFKISKMNSEIAISPSFIISQSDFICIRKLL